MKYNEWRVEKIQWAAMILIRIVIANILYGPKMACSYLCKTPCRVPMTIKPKTTGLLSIALIFRVCELKFEIESQPTEFHFIEWIFFRYYNSGARKPISKLRTENRNCVCVLFCAISQHSHFNKILFVTHWRHYKHSNTHILAVSTFFSRSLLLICHPLIMYWGVIIVTFGY